MIPIIKRSLSDSEDPVSVPSSQTVNPSILTSQIWSQSSPNLSQETKALSQSSPNLSQESKAVDLHIKKVNYVTNILELNDKIEGCVDVIGVVTERGKLETRTNRNGETIFRRNLLLEDASGKVVVSLKGQIAQDFGNMDGFPVVSVENCAIKKLKKLPKLLECIHGDFSSESDCGSAVSTPTSEVGPPFGNGSPRKKQNTNGALLPLIDQRYARELEYCPVNVTQPFELQSPRKKLNTKGASRDENDQKHMTEPECRNEIKYEMQKFENRPKDIGNIGNVVYLAANDSSSMAIDPMKQLIQ